MEPKEIFSKAVGPQIGSPEVGYTQPKKEQSAPGLQPRPQPARGSGTDSSKPDPITAALDRLAVLEPDLIELLGRTWLPFLHAAWWPYEAQGDPQPFLAAVDRLGHFVRTVARAEWMRATLEANHDPALPEIAAGLEPGALADRDLRRRWETTVERAWAFYLANLGVLRAEIPKELA